MRFGTRLVDRNRGTFRAGVRPADRATIRIQLGPRAHPCFRAAAPTLPIAMRVCIDYRPALHQATGVGTYVRGLLRGLLATHPDDRYTAFSASLRHRLEIPAALRGVEPLDVRFPVRWLDWLWHRRGWPPVELWSDRIDVAHSPSPMPMPARRAARLITIHDCYFLRHPEDVEGPIKRDYVPLVRAAAESSDAVLTVSETTREEIVDILGLPESRVHVTPLAVEPEFRPADPPDAEERAELSIPQRYLLFVGRREPRKGLDTLLEAFETIHAEEPDLELLLVGPPGLRWEESWKRASESVRGATICLSHRGSDTLPRLYAGAEALVLPSRWEGFGLTALEAAACGVPVVATRAGALPETLGEAAEWATVDDADDFAAACLRVLRSPERSAELRTAGLDRAAGYDWNRTAERTHEVYRAVAGR